MQEISRHYWADFCERFTRQHRGALVTIEVKRPGAAPQIVAHDLPLQSVSLDSKNSKRGLVQIRVGYETGERLSHFFAEATQLLFELKDSGAHVGLTLKGAHDTYTRLRFRAPFLPESVDGLMVPAG